jgi:hypothetical protein
MNFRIVLHLLKTDWQRIRRPIIAYWLLLIFAALPWWFQADGDLRMLQWMRYGRNGRVQPFMEDAVVSSSTNIPIFLLEIVSTILALILASMLGAQWIKQAVTPVRGRERLSAMALSLLLLMVLPLGLLAFVNLLLHGFSPGVAAMAVSANALSVWMLLGVAAALGAWLPSPWLLLAGCAALSSAVGFISEFYRPLQYGFRGYPVLPLLPAGPREWLFGGLAIALLVLLFPATRRRLNGPWKVVVAVGLIILAGIPAVLLPPADVHIKTDPAIVTDSIRPKLRNVGIQMTNESNSTKGSTLLISAYLQSTGCPPGHAVRWKPTSGWISQDGKRISTIRKEMDPLLLANEGYFDLGSYAIDADMAALAALPGNTNSARFSRFVESSSAMLGQAELPSRTLLSPDRVADLQMDFTGTVFRYERVWDVPLRDSPVKIQEGNLTWHVRQLPPDNGELWADVMVTYPALGVSKDPDQVRWDRLPISQYRLYFILPESGINLEASNQLLNASGPVFSGAGKERQVLAPINQTGKNFDLTGLRLVLLKPVPVARFQTTAKAQFRPWWTGNESDYALMHRYSVSETVYRGEWFSKRPDPKTCSREEFARWMRIPASLYGSWSSQDLASYAPRFSGLMAKAGNHDSVAEGLRLATPESLRDEVIGKIDSLERPDRLASVALNRGWLGEAGPAILRRFEAGDLWQSAAVMAMEDPSIYPELIARFLERPERETYEQLRMLPGIEPLLGEAIVKATSEVTPSLLKAKLVSYAQAPYGPFLYAAKLGDSQALETVLDLYNSGGDKSDYVLSRDLGYIISIPDFRGPKLLAAWLRDKSAVSFHYDPLLRIWKPLP